MDEIFNTIKKEPNMKTLFRWYIIGWYIGGNKGVKVDEVEIKKCLIEGFSLDKKSSN